MVRCRTDKASEARGGGGGVCDLLQRSSMHDYGKATAGEETGDQNKVARK